jgi:CDP-glycerol glycerophosphotransferase (TagB/SpsB family)
MTFFRHLMDVTSMMGLPRSERQIIFYSEGKSYWVHLEGILKEFLRQSNIPVCYVTSGKDDPGLHYKHPNLRSYKIDEGGCRNWLFKNIDTDLMVMTMPDIETYQVKRSKYPVHYVYVQHSIVSLHMIYRKSAFDYFDTVFCAGPHQVKEIRAIEEKYQLPEKTIIEHGYGRLDAIIENRKISKAQPPNNPKKILIAPSWGEHSLVETIGNQVVSHLLENKFHVILRPHPQTIKYAKVQIKEILERHKNNSNFELEVNIACQDSLHQSDLMISDWSGAALDYSFGLGKPVLFIDVPRKVNNPEYELLDIIPFEIWIRDNIGKTHSAEKLDTLSDSVNEILSNDTYADIDSIAQQNIFNIGKSAQVGAKYLAQFLKGSDC